jgi:hypothetical protein
MSRPSTCSRPAGNPELAGLPGDNLIANRLHHRALATALSRIPNGLLALMTNQQAAAASSRSHVATFTDPEAYALATVSLATGATAPRFVGTIGKTFQAKVARASLDRLGIGVGQASVPVAFTAGIPNAHVFMFATEPAAARQISGWTVGRQHIFHPRPNEQAYATSPSGMPWPYAVITAPFDLVAAHAPGAAGFDPKVPLNDDRLFLAPKPALARLVSLMQDAARLAEECPLDCRDAGARQGAFRRDHGCPARLPDPGCRQARPRRTRPPSPDRRQARASHARAPRGDAIGG